MLPFRLIALALMTIGVAACKPDAADPATPPPAAAPTLVTTPAPAATAGPTATAAPTAAPGVPPAVGAVPAAAPAGFRIVSVLLGNAVDTDNLVVSELGSFGRKDAIYASVLSTGSSQGLRISARWMAPDGSTIAETSQPLVPTAATVTTFSVRNPKGWPDGEYQVLIGIDGHAQLKKSFTVRR
ncbi:MAG: hypothetical protein ABIW30_06875 [Arenimonas sp.]